MPDIPFGGPGRAYDENPPVPDVVASSPAPETPFVAASVIAAALAPAVKPADDKASTTTETAAPVEAAPPAEAAVSEQQAH